MTTLASASLSRKHQEHRARMVGPLTVSLVLVWVWPHSLAALHSTINAGPVTYIVIATLAAVLAQDPAIISQEYSHPLATRP